MLYRLLLKLKEHEGLTENLKTKIAVFYATDQITKEQYNTLLDKEA